MKFVLLKKTEEEISRLPFPETARILGGILMPVFPPADPKLAEELRRYWNRCIKSNEFKTPIIGES